MDGAFCWVFEGALPRCVPLAGEARMTSASTRRAQSRQRGRRHRALRKRGKAAYCVRAHERRRAEALIKSGMPHHGSRHHQRRVRCWLRQARRPDRGSGDVDQCGSAVAPHARFDSPFSRASFSSPAGALARTGGGNAQKRGRASIPPRRRSKKYLVFEVLAGRKPRKRADFAGF